MEFLIKTGSILLVIFTLSLNPLNAQTAKAQKIIDAFNESYTLEKEGEYNKAIQKLQAIYNENSYEENLRLGWLSYMAGLLNDAISYYSKAIKLMPYSVEAHLGIVYPVSALGKWEEVITHYNEILKIDPKNSTANYRLGNIYYGRKQYEKAAGYFEIVLNMYPFDYDTLIMQAWTKLNIGQTAKAQVLFEKALMCKPNDESAAKGLELIKN